MSRVVAVLAVAVGLCAGCATAPKTVAARASLNEEAARTVQDMTARDPSLRPLLDRAAGYVVFPSVGQGGFIVGGAAGKGVVYEQGRAIGYAELSQASLGAQIGGQKFAELIVLRDRWALDRFKAGRFKFGGQASATALTAGAATATQFGANGAAVFVEPLGGAMLNVSLTGQQIRFKG